MNILIKKQKIYKAVVDRCFTLDFDPGFFSLSFIFPVFCGPWENEFV